MTWSDVREAVTDIWHWAVDHPLLAAAAIAGVLMLGALLISFDVAVTDRGVRVSFVRWTLYAIPFETIKKVYPSPLEWEVNILGFRFGNDPFYSSRWTGVFELSLDPFGKRVYIERTDGSLVILDPADRAQFIRDVQAHLKPDPVNYSDAEHQAEDVILRRIAQERADRAAHDQ